MIEATVIVAAWCAEATLERCVGSALNQADVALEIVIVDDASPDGTRMRAEALASCHPQVRVLSLERNGGPAVARNAAMDVARGDWVAILDSDDMLRPGRLRRLIDFARGTEADIVCDELVFIDEAGRESAPPSLAFPGAAQDRAWSLSDYIYGNQIHNGKLSLGFLKPLFRRAFLQDNGIRYDETLRNGEDFHLVLSALTAGAVLRFLPEPGYLYTTRKGSVSNRLDPDHARALNLADMAFLDRQGGRLTQENRRLMLERISRNADFAAVEVAMQALKAGQPLTAAHAIAGRPSATRQLLYQISSAARKRLGAYRNQ